MSAPVFIACIVTIASRSSAWCSGGEVEHLAAGHAADARGAGQRQDER